MQKEKQQTRVVATRVTQRFADLMEEYCQKEAHLNCANLMRDALREKIQRDAPELYKKLLGRI